MAESTETRKVPKAPRGAMRFRDRNPIPIGIIGMLVCVALVAVSLTYDRIGLLNGTHSATVYVADAAGLKAGDEVQVAGITVGQVRSLTLDGDHVRVDFDISRDVVMGDDTRAAIKTDSLLGRRALAVYSDGIGELPDRVIPLERTSVPYSLTDALGDATKTIDELDTDQVTQALDALSTTLDAAGPEVRGTLDGLTRLSRTLNDRDIAIKDLLTKANDSTDILARRSDQFTQIVNDGNTLFQALDERKRALSDLVRNINGLSLQLSGLVQDNEAQIGPALDKLEQVSDLLIRNKDSIDLALRRMVPYATALGEAVATGPFFNAYVANLSQPQYLQTLFHDVLPQVDPNLGPQPPLQREDSLPAGPGWYPSPVYPGWNQ